MYRARASWHATGGSHAEGKEGRRSGWNRGDRAGGRGDGGSGRRARGRRVGEPEAGEGSRGQGAGRGRVRGRSAVGGGGDGAVREDRRARSPGLHRGRGAADELAGWTRPREGARVFRAAVLGRAGRGGGRGAAAGGGRG